MSIYRIAVNIHGTKTNLQLLFTLVLDARRTCNSIFIQSITAISLRLCTACVCLDECNSDLRSVDEHLWTYCFEYICFVYSFLYRELDWSKTKEISVKIVWINIRFVRFIGISFTTCWYNAEIWPTCRKIVEDIIVRSLRLSLSRSFIRVFLFILSTFWLWIFGSSLQTYMFFKFICKIKWALAHLVVGTIVCIQKSSLTIQI